MGGYVLQLLGFKDLDEQLQRLTKGTAKAALKRGLTKAAAPLVEKLKAAAPLKTGLTVKSILSSTKSTTGKQLVGNEAFHLAMRRNEGREAAVLAKRDALRALGDDGGAPFVELFVGVSGRAQKYAHFQEFGTSKEPARPWARPAWDADKYAMLDRIKAELAAEIAKTIARAAKRGRLVG